MYPGALAFANPVKGNEYPIGFATTSVVLAHLISLGRQCPPSPLPPFLHQGPLKSPALSKRPFLPSSFLQRKCRPLKGSGRIPGTWLVAPAEVNRYASPRVSGCSLSISRPGDRGQALSAIVCLCQPCRGLNIKVRRGTLPPISSASVIQRGPRRHRRESPQ